MGHATGLDKQLELAGDKLGAIVRNDPQSSGRELLPDPLQDDLDLGFGHLFPDFPMDAIATVAIQDQAQVVKDAAQVQVSNVNMPVLMGLRGLLKALPFAGRRFLSGRQ